MSLGFVLIRLIKRWTRTFSRGGNRSGCRRSGCPVMIEFPVRLVVNTSPLIHLAGAGLLHLLREAAPTVWVPEPVTREIRRLWGSRPHGAGSGGA